MEPPTQFFVANSGSDSNPGTLALPFATPSKCQTAIQSKIVAGIPYIVCNFRGGTTQATRTRYSVTTPLNGTSADQPTGLVTWQSYPGEFASFDAGVQITGWATCNDAGVPCQGGAAGLFKATIPANSAFREMYTNDQWATRIHGAMQPAGWTVSSTLTAPDNSMSSWSAQSKTDLEVSLLSSFPSARCHFTSVTGSPNTVLSGGNCVTRQNGNFVITAKVQWVENAAELLTAGNCAAGGCWYANFTTNVVYYLPRAGETTGTLTAYVPTTVGGAVQNILTGTWNNVKFSRLYFEDTTYPDQGTNGWVNADGADLCTSSNTSAPTGCTNSDLTPSHWGTIEAAVHITGNAALDHDEIWHNGGVGVWFDDGSRSPQITSSRIEQNGAGDVHNGNFLNCGNVTPSTQTSGLLIQDTILGRPQEYYGWTNAEFDCTLSTTLNRVDLSGTSLALNNGSWTTPFYGGGALIENSKIHDSCISTVAFDCGLVHFGRSNSPSSTVTANWLTGTSAGGPGFYIDNSASGVTGSGNVIDGLQSGLACGAVGSNGSCWAWFNNPTTGNTLSGNYAEAVCTSGGDCHKDQGSGNTVSGTISTTGNNCAGLSGGQLTSCQAIINGAGPQGTPGP